MKWQKFLVSVLGAVCIWGQVALAADNPVKWDWIQSDDNYGKFIDSGSIVLISNGSGKLEHIDVTVRNAYSLNGAREEVASYGKELSKAIDPAALAYSIQKLRLYPEAGRLDSQETLFYNKAGVKLGQGGRLVNLNVAFRDFYAPYFYYTLDKITTNREYEAWKSKEHYLTLRSLKDVDGTEYLAELDTLTLREQANVVSGYVWYTTQNPGTAPQYLLAYNQYDLKNTNWKRTEVYHNNGPKDRGETLPTPPRHMTAAPGSAAEKERSVVLKYYQEHQDWVHRYERGVYKDTRLAK